MPRRIREAMPEYVKSSGPIGGEGKTVDADETCIGRRETPRAPPKLRNGRPHLKSGGANRNLEAGTIAHCIVQIRHARMRSLECLRVCCGQCLFSLLFGCFCVRSLFSVEPRLRSPH